MKKIKKNNLLKYINKPILILSILFAIIGALLILDASSISSQLIYGNDSPYYYFQRQLLFIGISFFLSLIIIKVDNGWYKSLSFIASLLFIGIIFVIYLKNSLFSSDVNEVTISILGGSFQPAEFLKVFLIMYMGCFYGKWANTPKHAKFSFIIPLVIAFTSAFLIFLGGDFGSAAVMIALFALIFISVPSKEKIVKYFKALAIVMFAISILLLKYAYVFIPEEKLESNYRLNRLIYKNPCDRYEENSGYQVCNGYIAIDNGGLFGSGIGESVQKYLYLPASHTDFIFPIVVEEFGVIVGIILIICYAAVLYFVFKVATNTNKLQNSLICYGIGIYFMLHIFVNLGGVLGVIPLTGVPLPFLSYGGSFCMSIICSFAVVQRINIENNLEKLKK